MIQIELKKKSSYGERGDVIYVDRNIAHGLVERGEGKIYKAPTETYVNRMMKSKSYKTKRNAK